MPGLQPARSALAAGRRWKWRWSYTFRKRHSTRETKVGLSPEVVSVIVKVESGPDETKDPSETRAGGSSRPAGTGDEVRLARPPQEVGEVLGVRRGDNRPGGWGAAMLGVPQAEDQRLARDRAANADAGIGSTNSSQSTAQRLPTQSLEPQGLPGGPRVVHAPSWFPPH